MRFSVPDMSCGHCRSSITKALASLDPSAQVAIDGEGRTIEVSTDRRPEEVQHALRQVGYESAPA